MIKYEINPDFQSLKPFVDTIQQHFSNNSSIIHQARNTLKKISYQNASCVVKKFKIPNLFNRVVYTFFRASKAKRSYQNACYLQSQRISTPTPVAYIEFYKNGLLHESYYIALEQPYDFTIREVLLRKFSSSVQAEVLQAFMAFTARLHDLGIEHKDYTPGNILIHKEYSGSYVFSLVDLNRMAFHSLSLKNRIKNMGKLIEDDEMARTFAENYAEFTNFNGQLLFLNLRNFYCRHENKKRRKQTVKKFLGW